MILNIKILYKYKVVVKTSGAQTVLVRVIGRIFFCQPKGEAAQHGGGVPAIEDDHNRNDYDADYHCC